MLFNSQGYKKAIENEFTIINKDKEEVRFDLNKAQNHFIKQMESNLNLVILKARKMGFSSVILAIAVLKFIFGKNERCVSMSFDRDASRKQLERAKHFLRSFEISNEEKFPLKYDNKYELVYEGIDDETGNMFRNTLRIGTAKSNSFGRGDDITFLHLTEVAHCTNLDELLSGVGEACVNNTHKLLETTAHGFNEFKGFWDKAILGDGAYKPLFYGPEWEYDEKFLAKKLIELGDRLFMQEYPRTPDEAFLTSGECYFDTKVLGELLGKVQDPINFQFS